MRLLKWFDDLFFKWLDTSTCPHHHFKINRELPYSENWIKLKCKHCGKIHRIKVGKW